MRVAALRYPAVALAALGIAVAGVGGAGPAVAARSKTPAVGDRCLIGTWRDNGGISSTKWNGHRVRMRFRGNDFDHIPPSGVDRDGWDSSKGITGRYHGHPLEERIRGSNQLLLRAGGPIGHQTLVMTEQGWTRHSTNRYLYRGQYSTGYLNQTGTRTVGFRCTLTTLTFFGPRGHRVGSETRVSFKP
jgi:hypothetical protein